MAILNFQILLCSFCMFFCILFPETSSLTFNLPNLANENQDVNIMKFGDAIGSSQGLQITSDLPQQVGKITYKESFHLWDNYTGELSDFSTHFVFVIDSEGYTEFADGFTFFLAPDGSRFTVGGAMGLPIDPVTIEATSPFVAVEFDTFHNVWDPINVDEARHVGIDVDSLKSSVTAAWCPDITHGLENEAWIRYDSSSHKLSVVFTNHTGEKGSVNFVVDLRKCLPERVTIGFSAATGAFSEKHVVKSWEFSSS